MRLGTVLAHPPDRGSAAAALSDAMRQEFDVAVCAVSARASADFPDDVVMVIARDDVEEYRRAGRILAEHAVDCVLIPYEHDAYGGLAGSHACELAAALADRGVAYVVAVPETDWAGDPCQIRTLRALTAGAARVLLFSGGGLRLAAARGLARPSGLAVVTPDPAAIVGIMHEAIVESVAHMKHDPAPLPLDRLAVALADRVDDRGRRYSRATARVDAEVFARRTVAAGRLSALAPTLAPPVWIVGTSRYPYPSGGGPVGRGLRAGLSPADVGWTVWGLGSVATGSGWPATARRAARRRRDELAGTLPRDLLATAYVALGLCHDGHLGPASRQPLRRAAARLGEARRAASPYGQTWRWFSGRLGREDARLSQALIGAGRHLADGEALALGLDTLEWYCGRVGLATADGMLRLPPRFAAGADVEHAVDAAALVEALVEAYTATGAVHHARLARRSFDWFLGANRAADPVYSAASGLCREGVSRRTAAVPVSTTATLAFIGALTTLASAGLLAAPVAESARRDLAAVA